MVEVARTVDAGELVVSDPVDLRHRGVHVDARSDGTGDEEAVGREAEGVGRPPVPPLGTGLPGVERVRAPGHVVEHVAQAEVAEVDQLGRDALAVHVGQPQHGIVKPVPVLAVRLLMLGEGRGACALPGLRR